MICIGIVVCFTRHLSDVLIFSIFLVPAPGKDSMKMKVMMKGLLPESTLIRFAKKSLNISVSNVAGKPPKIRTIKDNHLPCLNGNSIFWGNKNTYGLTFLYL
jgi:hypothetical protein